MEGCGSLARLRALYAAHRFHLSGLPASPGYGLHFHTVDDVIAAVSNVTARDYADIRSTVCFHPRPAATANWLRLSDEAARPRAGGSLRHPTVSPSPRPWRMNE
jgi:hypothetical protein